MSSIRQNTLKTKSYQFAIAIVNICRILTIEKKEYILSKQLLRSGTSIGANIEEANQAESRLDFIHKLSIANKEAFETHYWIRILRDTDFIDSSTALLFLDQCEELIKMLTSSINSSKKSLKH
ncbi:MAG: four helix bundle protein [Bacteroidota bacterium]